MSQQHDDRSVFADFVGEHVQTDEQRADFDRQVAKLVAQSDLLNALESIREDKGITKKQIADHMHVRPSVVSRLLNGKAQNPTLATLVDVADAMDVYLDIHIKPQPRSSRHAPISVQSATSLTERIAA